MKKYGLRIGTVGVEFSRIEDRDKAMMSFTRGGVVKINTSSGIRYADSENAFSVYDRESNEVLANCHVCEGVFSTETCSKRDYPKYESYSKKWSVETYYFICDGCLAQANRAKEIADARTRLENVESQE